jgi:GT2 family glycosyltransferase
MKIRVLVINLNNINYTKNCINLLLKQNFNKFEITLFDQNSIENGTEEMLSFFEDKGIDIVRSKNNIPVNSVWNWFYKTYDEDILCFLNNDVLIYDNFISDVVYVFENERNVGVVVHSTNHDSFTTKKNKTEYVIVEPKKFMQGWDFSIKRDVFTLIPEQLKTYCGDDFLFHNLYEKGFDLAYIISSPMIHFEGQSKPFMIHGGVADIHTYINMGLPHYLKINNEYSNIKPTNIFISND